MFDFEKEIEELELTLSDYEEFLENDKEYLSEYSEDEIKKIYILQETALKCSLRLGLDADKFGEAMSNLRLNY